MTGTSADGMKINGSYYYIKGLDFKGAPHNGLKISGGNYNIVEFCTSFENRNTGVQLSTGASYNRFINCDSYYNYDAPSGGNADGFSPKLDVGTGNYFYGCRSWQNSDDGWDGYLRPSDDVTDTVENCWAFMNGYLKNWTVCPGNGNGFKTGGSDAKNLKHNMVLKNCLAFHNKAKGFDQNNNLGSITFLNCTSYENGIGTSGGHYNFSVPTALASGKVLTVENCITLGSTKGVTLNGPVLATNSWPDASTYPTTVTSATSADFVSIDTTGVRGPRKPDGSLPDITFMHLAQGSQFIDGGTNVGLPYLGLAPDLGAFETLPGALPVELTSFFASAEAYNVVLKWNTATEVDNYGFDIERRKVPSGTWQQISFVAGSGTSNSTQSYEYADNNVVSGRYAYRLKQIDATGLFKYYNEVEVVVGNMPSMLSLSEAYPNPFNPSTVIRFSVAVAGMAKLHVINILGQHITTLFSGHAEPGTVYPIQFNAASLPSGVYFSVLESNGKQEVKKMLLMK
jgi:hypothetical protein